MTASSLPRPSRGFAGINLRRASDEQLERAHRQTKRHHADRRLAAKLDDLLGAVDDLADDEPKQGAQ